MLKFAVIALNQKRDNSPLHKEFSDELIELILKADPDFNFCIDLWESCGKNDEIVKAFCREKEEIFDYDVEEVKVGSHEYMINLFWDIYSPKLNFLKKCFSPSVTNIL